MTAEPRSRPASPATMAVTAGRPTHEPDAPLNPPITMASTYVAGGDLEYGRYANPTWAAFEEVLGALEGGRCLAFASGLAAVATVLDLVGQDATVVAPRHAYRGYGRPLADLESRGRLTSRAGRHRRHRRGGRGAATDAALVWIESPTNPALELADIPALTEAAHAAGAASSSTTPSRRRCSSGRSTLGADIVVHSATKYLAGHTDVLLGAVVTRDDELFAVLKRRRDLVGAIPGTARGLARAARDAHAAPARRAGPGQRRRSCVAGSASTRRSRRSATPGFGAIVAVVLAGGATAADLLTHTHAAVGARHLASAASSRRSSAAGAGAPRPPRSPRAWCGMSVGIEDVEDLWADLEQALDALP